MKRKLLYTLMFSSVIVLTACGGGGGGGGPYSSSNPYLRTEVPYTTPVRVATIDPLSQNKNSQAVVDSFVADITGSGADIIIAGRESQPATSSSWSNSKISMLSWENGTLVDKTAQWFPGGINEILGTEPSVKFADFFKTGRQDMFVAPSTDMNHYGPAYLFTNNGSSFSRQSIVLNNVWAHDSAIADLNGDTFKDIAITDYGPNTTLAINNQVNGFTTYTDPRGTRGDLRWGGSSIAVADFMQNGSTQLIMTDNSCNTANAACGASSTKMYSWAITAGELNYTYMQDLPLPRFDLPKWSSYGFGGSHNIRAVAFDFSDDGVPDALIFSMPTPATPTQSTKYSEIQFLKNNGTGSFSDVTDSVLIGYNTNTYASYNPKFIDLNGDGKTDILVSGSDWTGANNSTQFLLKSSDGKYVAAYQNILTDFSTQVNSIQGTTNAGNTVNIFRAPTGKLYLVSAVNFLNGTDRQLAVYMSELGNQNTTTAQSAINLILQKWPYMSTAQANEALARTSATYFGGRVIDLESMMNPIGSLSISTTRGLMPISGYIAGVNIDGGQAVIVDELRRPFNTNLSSMNINRLNAFSMNTEHIDQHNLTSHAEYLVNGNVVSANGLRLGSENRSTFNGTNEGPGMLTKPTQYTIGIPDYYRKGNFTLSTQYTSLNSNPWIAFGGSWGSINNSTILDNVVTWRDRGFSAQASVMHVSTNITPGLVTQVNNMVGGWAEAGYRYTETTNFGDLGIYAGVKPVVFSGSVETKMPTGVDNSGNIVYTNKKLAVQNQATGYVRALYSKALTKQTLYRISGMATADGQYRVMNEVRFFLD